MERGRSMSRLRKWLVGVQYPPKHRGVTPPSCSLSRRPCQARTRRCGQWLKMPTEAAARPVLGTHCPGTWEKHRGAGAAEGAPGAMGVSWTLPSGQSSALQVMLRALSVQFGPGHSLVDRALAVGSLQVLGLGWEGDVLAGPRRTLQWQAPPAGPLLSAAGGLRLRPEVAFTSCGATIGLMTRSQCPDAMTLSWALGQSPFQSLCSWLPPLAVRGRTQEQERTGHLVPWSCSAPP